MYDLRVAPDAVADLDEALVYLASVDVELMFDLQDEVDAFFLAISERPLSFQRHSGGPARRAFLNKFQYGIYFLIDADTVVVLGIFHFRDDPEKIAGRVGGAA